MLFILEAYSHGSFRVLTLSEFFWTYLWVSCVASFSVSLLDLLVRGSCLSIKHVPVIGKNHFSHQRNIFSLFSVYVGQILSSDLPLLFLKLLFEPLNVLFYRWDFTVCFIGLLQQITNLIFWQLHSFKMVDCLKVYECFVEMLFCFINGWYFASNLLLSSLFRFLELFYLQQLFLIAYV